MIFRGPRPSRLMMFCLLALLPFAASAGTLPAAGLAPHKALYEIRLASTKSGSQVVNVSGKMLYEWQPDCDGWLSNHRFDLTYEYADSPAVKIKSDFSTYESFDGRSMDFASTRRNDGEIFQELRGHASLDDKGGTADYSLPDDLSFALPAGGLFPMGHTLNVLDHIRKGDRFYTATVFDGSDENGPVEINTVIGNPVDALKNLGPDTGKDIDKSLLQSPARTLHLAFFPLDDNQTDTPDYEMRVAFHENGIISDMFIEYGSFSVTQKLVALEPLDNACDKHAP